VQFIAYFSTFRSNRFFELDSQSKKDLLQKIVEISMEIAGKKNFCRELGYSIIVAAIEQVLHNFPLTYHSYPMNISPK
jgi:hypothetical protein